MNKEITNIVMQSLDEDIACGDLSSQLIDSKKALTYQLLSREECILCGAEWFNQSFLQLDPNCKISWNNTDKNKISVNSEICTITGNARALLSAERTALNFLQTLSGTATTTYEYVNLIKHTQTQLLDTRKTIPLFRHAQKYAVCCGGGVNHRYGLYDAFLLKENHIASSNGITDAIQRARKLDPNILLEVEVENLEQLDEVIRAGADRVMLDNFSLGLLQQAIVMTRGHIQSEASGNITKSNIAEIAETGVDFISIGAITKHIRAIDFSLRFEE